MESLFQSISYNQYMGDSTPKPVAVCCPMCGESLSGLTTKKISQCPACGFNTLLVEASRQPSIPATVPAYIPRFTLWLLLAQVLLAALIGTLFLFFASSLYYPFSLVFVGIQFISIGVLLAFIWALRQEMAISGIRITLPILGVITLPLGSLAIGAAMSIAPLRRWCCTCRKLLRGSAYIECSHCEASMHSMGRCRQNQFHQIAGLLDYTPTQSEIEQICANCLKVLSEPVSRGNEHE
jgi:hypothetical protein